MSMGSNQNEQPRRSRVAWLRSIPGIVSFIGVLLAAGFSGIYICNNTVCGPEPMLRVDPSEVAPGGEAGLIGKDLNLVSEVYLSSLERPPIRIYHKPENEERLTVAVPWSVPPGEYWIEVRWKNQFLPHGPRRWSGTKWW